MKTISVILPVYYEEEVLPETYRRMTKVMQGMTGTDYELVFVNDGSRDKTLEMLREISSKDSHVAVVSFSRNFGHQVAITAGMDYARGDAVVVIDADLQDPPELIPEMVQRWSEGWQVVHAKRKKRRGESVFKRWTAGLFYRFIDALSEIRLPRDVGDFKLLDRAVVDALQQIREKNRYVRGMVAWLGFRQTEVLFERDPRFAGETKYPLSKMLRFAMDGITSFSLKPLKLATRLGFLSIVIGLLLVVWVLISKYIYPESTVSGWSSLLIAVVFFGGVQLLTIGIMGEYIGRIYDETRNRPLYVIDELINTQPHEQRDSQT